MRLTKSVKKQWLKTSQIWWRHKDRGSEDWENCKQDKSEGIYANTPLNYTSGLKTKKEMLKATRRKYHTTRGNMLT